MQTPSGDTLRMTYGFLVLVILAVLAAIFAIGKVTEAESFGLMPIITSLATLAGGFSQWAFAGTRQPQDKEKQ